MTGLDIEIYIINMDIKKMLIEKSKMPQDTYSMV